MNSTATGKENQFPAENSKERALVERLGLNSLADKFHPAANIFPILSADDFQRLVEDIKANGQREPVKMLDGKIVDGRHRFRACVQLGLMPDTEDVEVTDPVAYVISLNLMRRHLTVSERAAIAVDIEARYAEEARGRQAKTRISSSQPVQIPVVAKLQPAKLQPEKSAEKAAKHMGVSPRTVAAAKRLKEQNPAAFQEVKAGKVTLEDAKREVARSAPPPAASELSFIDAKKAEAARMGEIKGELHRLVTELLEIADTPIGVYLKKQALDSALCQLKQAIKFAMPFATCPYCGGKKCKNCNQAGWLDKLRYEQTPQDLRDVNAKAEARK